MPEKKPRKTRPSSDPGIGISFHAGPREDLPARVAELVRYALAIGLEVDGVGLSSNWDDHAVAKLLKHAGRQCSLKVRTYRHLRR